MKNLILNQKISVIIFTVMFFVFGVQSINYADLQFTEGDITTREIAENKAAGARVGPPLISIPFDSNCNFAGYFFYTLSGPDASAFEHEIYGWFEGTQLRTKFPLDYESKKRFEVIVNAFATDTTETGRITVIINVINVNEAPEFIEKPEIHDNRSNHIHRSIQENTMPGENIGNPISAIDPDGPDVALTYSISGINADMFEVDSETGQLITKEPIDYEAFDREPYTYFVDIKVSDGMASSEMQVWIDVKPVNEFAPVFLEGSTAIREIYETGEVGVNVGEPILAIDMDAGETLEYSLNDTDNETFEVDSVTGQLKTKVSMEYRTKSIHTVDVTVSDGSRIDNITVTVFVLQDIVEVPDRSLAKMIRVSLGIATDDVITKEAMLELTRLDAGPKSRLSGLREIEYLTGLERAENLTTLLLGSNSVKDLTPLKGLTKLTRLEIYSNYVFSITPLEGLTNLKILHFGRNAIEDITALKGLTNLTELFLQVNHIKDITPLKELTNLKILYLNHNHLLTDISPLAGLVNLETLKLKGCPITDFTPLEGLTADIDVLE